MMDAEHLCMDGTWKSAPNLFTQLFTIHRLFDQGWNIPLAYGLLPGKTTTLYTNLLEELDSFGPFSPQSVLCDFELAIHNAVGLWSKSGLLLLSVGATFTTSKPCSGNYSSTTWWRSTVFLSQTSDATSR